MSEKNTWADNVETLRAAMSELRRTLVDSWAVPTVEWLNRKLTR